VDLTFGGARLRFLSAAADTDQRRAGGRGSILPTSGSCNAPAIRQRHISQPMASFTSHLAINAAQAALARIAGIDAQSIDLIVLATVDAGQTPFPPPRSRCRTGSASIMGAAFDLQAVCSGFVFAARHRRQFPARRQLQARAGDRRRGRFSRILDWGGSRHLACCFGDGAGANRARRRRRRPGKTHRPRACWTTHLRSDGRHKSKTLCRWAGPSSTKTVGFFCGWKAARSSSTRSA